MLLLLYRTLLFFLPQEIADLLPPFRSINEDIHIASFQSSGNG